MSFDTLGLKPELLRAVADKGYTVPTPIQLEAIPPCSPAATCSPARRPAPARPPASCCRMLQKLGSRGARNPRALVLTPTRELAAQVEQSVQGLRQVRRPAFAGDFGGVSEKPQIDKLRQGCDILVATPGRLLDLCEQRAVSLADVQIFVLDEADRMLDMGFIRDIKRVLKMLPAQRQNLMFSATYSDDIRELASRFLRNPVALQVTPRNATAEKVEQSAYRVPKDHKRHLLAHLINEGNWHQVLVFTRTKHGANRLTQQLERAGINAMAIHGNKSQNARVKALQDFKDNKITALVATEVAARGLDIKELPHVVNYELPNVPEDYVHRIGRTARAGSTGAAISLVSPDERQLSAGHREIAEASDRIRTERRSSRSRRARTRRARNRRAARAPAAPGSAPPARTSASARPQGGAAGIAASGDKPAASRHARRLSRRCRREHGIRRRSAAAPRAEREPGGEKRPQRRAAAAAGTQRSGGPQQGGPRAGVRVAAMDTAAPSRRIAMARPAGEPWSTQRFRAWRAFVGGVAAVGAAVAVPAAASGGFSRMG